MIIRIPSRWLAVLLLIVAHSSKAHGALDWDNPVVELTASAGEKEVIALFRFKNTGDNTVTVTTIQTSCGCTIAELAKRTYAPGETGEMKVVYNLGGAVGQTERTIQVTADNAPEKPVHLTLRVKIPELFTCSTRMLLWKIGEAPDEKPVEISAVDPHKLTGVEVKFVTPNQATFRIESFAAGTKYRLFVRPNATATAAQVALFCAVKFADGTTQPITIYALVR